MGDQKIAKNHQKWSFFDHFWTPLGQTPPGIVQKGHPGVGLLGKLSSGPLRQPEIS